MLDILFSLIGLIFLLPVSLLVWLAYLCSGDFHCIIYTQTRIGKNGKPFKMFKFRTMVPDADKKLAELMDSDSKFRKEYEINHKIQDDPRMTGVGKLLRIASIDELPQCINVLFGQMSIIGNRPYLPAERPAMGDYYNIVTSTKPGITGYWQVSGRNDLTFYDRLKLEKEYAKTASLGLDTKIFFKTIGAVFSRRGAK